LASFISGLTLLKLGGYILLFSNKGVTWVHKHFPPLFMNNPPLEHQLFQKKSKLDLQKILLICYIALYQNTRGTIKRLSVEYNISRQYIYILKHKYQHLAENYFQKPKLKFQSQDTKKSLELMCSLRLEGACSIGDISTILSRLFLPNNSIGFISEKLQELGRLVGNNLSLANPEELRFVFCCDEIFAKGTPILIAVDPVSLLILRIELCVNFQSLSWEDFWNSLLAQGYIPLSLCKDEGVIMKAAQGVVLPDTPIQSDTFHAVSHRLGLWRIRLEKAAYTAIGIEYEALRLKDNAKSQDVLAKRTAHYVAQQALATEAIALYELFNWLYQCLLNCFECFDHQGKLKAEEQVIGDFETALTCIESLGHKKINEEIKSIHACKGNLFYFMEVAKKIVAKLSETIDSENLQDLCLAWQINKRVVKIKHHTDLRNKYIRRRNHILNGVEKRLGITYEKTKNETEISLDNIVQSSAAVECINSLLRPYLNTCKNQVSQEFLNLFMFYHNHRRFNAGKRKDKTPFEIATGTVQEKDWIALLLEKVNQ
jgi:hypothetical protein